MGNKKIAALSLSLTVLSGTQAWAAGYEKSIMFGGRSSGVAGIATPYVQGSEALYFNPAGLARDKEGQDVSVNVSPTQASFSAPFTSNGSAVSADKHMIFPLGAMYNRSINDSIGLGIGYYVSGGINASYSNISITGLGGAADAKSDLAISELALGGGYKVNENFRLGLSYRVVMAKAAFTSLTPVSGKPGYYANTAMTGLTDTEYTGFKLGAQYKLGEKAAFGLTYRSSVNLKAKGTSNTSVLNSGANLPGGSDSVTLATVFPDAWTLGANYKLTDTWNLLWEYVFTSYSRVQNLGITGSNGTTTNLDMKWQDQHNVRLAGEYLGFGLPVRFGYVWTSQVVKSDYARPTFTPPGQGHTITLGTGEKIAEGFDVNGGLEYTMVNGSGTNNANSGVVAGTYKVDEYALHLGASYTF